MAFSGALILTDLNDFITPSQACIKPVEQVDAPTEEKEPGAASTEILIDSAGAYFEVSGSTPQTNTPAAPGKKLTQAQISLNDCLACSINNNSGCITSAESVLITLQSHTEVLTFLASNGAPSSPGYKLPVISISPQSLASLAASLSSSAASTSASASTSSADALVTPRQVLRRIQVFCRDVLGFAHVFDTTFARHLALREHVAEFLERREGDAGGGEGELPMLASACPGWICYAEKAHKEMLPFIARTKSPQQVMGTLVKEWMGERWGKTPDGIYHVSVMPCYDKKLEASRQDFYNDVYSTRDVDCVITTGELELMMRERGWNLDLQVPGEFSSSSTDLPELLQHPGTSSGSYLHSIISHLQSSSPTPLLLSVKAIRNADYEEYTLTEDADAGTAPGKVVFKGAKCYGFRNLQNIVRKVGKERGVRTGAGAAGKLAGRAAVVRRARKGGVEEKEKERNYDYVEVMACPGGCVNGGGQVKPRVTAEAEPVVVERDEEKYERNWEESGVSVDGIQSQSGKWGDKDWTRKVESAYWRASSSAPVSGPGPVRGHDLPTPPDTPPHGYQRLDLEEGCSMEIADRAVKRVMDELCGRGGASVQESRRRHFRTQYRAVESEVVGLAVKW
ncbi:iron hydrogenase [Crassisporium funariophilum]|nr:iron hydrogenase [Crassisporium funariophilum]